MTHQYSDTFFDYIETGARASARVVLAEADSHAAPRSVLDLGCGRGAWLAEWQTRGVQDAHGVDGPWVSRDNLLIPQDNFHPQDLTKPLDLGRRFDLVQSLEVAEHLPPDAARIFVENLTRHGDIVLFSAAVLGQGGENHINERPLTYWQDLFAEAGYVAHDALRPVLRDRAEVEPWYRYNSVLYANAAGQARLSEAARASAIPAGQPVPWQVPFSWRLRCAIVRALPRVAVTGIAQINAQLRALNYRRAHHAG